MQVKRQDSVGRGACLEHRKLHDDFRLIDSNRSLTMGHEQTPMLSQGLVFGRCQGCIAEIIKVAIFPSVKMKGKPMPCILRYLHGT